MECILFKMFTYRINQYITRFGNSASDDIDFRIKNS